MTAAVVFAATAAAHEPITTKVTFTKEIVRILQQRCLGCHQEGGAAFSLASYADARPWAKAIKEEVLEGRMPPWHAVKGTAVFRHDLSLTILEKELLVDWVEGGAPKGEDKDLPPAKAAGKDLGKPGLLVPGPAATADRWIHAWEFRPKDPAALAEVEFWIVSAGQRTYLGNWVPPLNTVTLPDGVGVLLPAGSRIQMHPRYNPDHEAAGEPGNLALYFAAKPPARRLREMPLTCGPVRLPQGISALAIRPTRSLEVVALRPDQTVETLGLFDGVPESASATYWYKDPVSLPLGTTLEVRSPEKSCSGYLAYTTR